MLSARGIRNTLIRKCFKNQENFASYCQSIVNRHNGDCDYEFETNGEFRFAQETLPSARVVFDVGANVGMWVKSALTFNPRAQYHCFEPCPGTFAELTANGFPENVILNNFGLGNTQGELPMYLDPLGLPGFVWVTSLRS